MTDVNETDMILDDLKAEATELGISFSPNIGAAKLKEKIDAHYDSKETVTKELEETLEATKENSVTKNEKVDPALAMRMLAAEMRKEANKLRSVIIHDNDKNQNHLTTTCTVNCSNQYFDLGTKFFPLNEKIKVRQGHLNVLAECKMQVHTRAGKGDATFQHAMRPRYSIEYFD